MCFHTPFTFCLVHQHESYPYADHHPTVIPLNFGKHQPREGILRPDVTGVGTLHAQNIQICSTLCPALLHSFWLALLAQETNGPFACLQFICPPHSRFCSIKIYLSVVYFKHIHLVFPDPLVDCQLQCVLGGIKPTQVIWLLSFAYHRPPLTDHSQDTSFFQSGSGLLHSCLFWVSEPLWIYCSILASLVTLVIHLTASNIAVDSHKMLSCLQLYIKAFKTNPFRKSSCLLISLGNPLLCAVSAILNYQPLCGYRGHCNIDAYKLQIRTPVKALPSWGRHWLWWFMSLHWSLFACSTTLFRL